MKLIQKIFIITTFMLLFSYRTVKISERPSWDIRMMAEGDTDDSNETIYEPPSPHLINIVKTI